MLRIRLQRTGRENRPSYRLVVAEHTAPIKGKYLENVGHYNPIANPHVFEYNLERIRHWISFGAQPTNTVARLLKGKGVDGMEKFIVEMKNRKSKKEPVAAPVAPQAASAPVEAPKEPVPASE